MKRENIGKALAIQTKLQKLEQWISALEHPERLDILIRDPNAPAEDRLLTIKHDVDYSLQTDIPSSVTSGVFLAWVESYLNQERNYFLNQIQDL
jgi:hypothetical protein